MSGVPENGHESLAMTDVLSAKDKGSSGGQQEVIELVEIVHIDSRPLKKQEEEEEGEEGDPADSVRSKLLPNAAASKHSDHMQKELRTESIWMTFIQVCIPFLIAGFGTVTAGRLLDEVQRWSVYEEFNELFILVPALLGLKGNLEMTLASRLSTAANTGALDTWSSWWKCTWGNLVLIQAQALVVALLATTIALVVEQDFSPSHILLLAASSLCSASAASALLASLMILIILTSQRLRINPDNVATPFAASLGDLVTLGLLSLVAQGLYKNEVVHVPIAIALVVTLVLPIPLWCYLAYRNQITHNVLLFGWIPVITAMCISSGGGFVLAKAIGEWPSIAAYTPIINGIGGNLVAVQASRISTSLHSSGTPGSQHSSQMYMGPHRTFFSIRQDSKTAVLLVFLVVPGSALFLFVVHAMDLNHTVLTPSFMAGYIIAASLQVIVLLLVADWMVRYVWKMGWDPDNIAIPFLTALGDLLGTSFLAVCFVVTGRSPGRSTTTTITS